MVYMALGLCRNCRSKLRNPIYYQNNKEHILAKSKQYREEHPGYADESKRKYRETHRKECNQRIANWAQTHKLERANNEARRRATKVQNGVAIFDINDIIKRDKSLCGICGKKVLRKDLAFDHIIPIACGGGHIPSNVQVSHCWCNSRKGIGYLPSQTRLAMEVI